MVQNCSTFIVRLIDRQIVLQLGGIFLRTYLLSSSNGDISVLIWDMYSYVFELLLLWFFSFGLSYSLY